MMEVNNGSKNGMNNERVRLSRESGQIMLYGIKDKLYEFGK